MPNLGMGVAFNWPQDRTDELRTARLAGEHVMPSNLKTMPVASRTTCPDCGTSSHEIKLIDHSVEPDRPLEYAAGEAGEELGLTAVPRYWLQMVTQRT